MRKTRYEHLYVLVNEDTHLILLVGSEKECCDELAAMIFRKENTKSWIVAPKATYRLFLKRRYSLITS